MHHWMFNCHEVTRLVSESLDRKLPLYQRMGIRMHLFMCRFCSRYKKQLLLIREVLTHQNESDCAKEVCGSLSNEARERIKHVLMNSQKVIKVDGTVKSSRPACSRQVQGARILRNEAYIPVSRNDER